MKNTRILCECGKRLRLKDEHSMTTAKCPSCGAIFALPSPSHGPPPPDAINKPSREWVLWAAFAGVLAGVVVLMLLFYSKYGRDRTNRVVAGQLREARSLLAKAKWDDAISVLDRALAIPNATDHDEASGLKERATTSKRAEQESRLIAQAEQAITELRFSEAVRLLGDEANFTMGRNRAHVGSLIGQLAYANSDAKAMELLRSLPDDQLSEGSIAAAIDSQTEMDHTALKAAFRDRVLKGLPDEKLRRDEVRREEQAVRVAKEAEERAKRLERERLAEFEAEKIVREEAKRRQFSGRGPKATRKFELSRGLSIVKVSHEGSSNFSVKLLDDRG